MSVRLSARITASPTGRITVKFDIGDIWEYVENTKFGLNRTKTSGSSHEDLRMFGCRRNEVTSKALLTEIYSTNTQKEPIVARGKTRLTKCATIAKLCVRCFFCF